MNSSWWKTVSGSDLAQGDLLPNCQFPVLGESIDNDDSIRDLEIESFRLIILSQSCDLENKKIQFVALCPSYTVVEFTDYYPEYNKSDKLESIRRGKHYALHMCAATDNKEKAYIVDFGQIISLPISYLSCHANDLGNRSRLLSPFLEHFSQAFARFFMRVGLPSSIPPFK